MGVGSRPDGALIISKSGVKPEGGYVDERFDGDSWLSGRGEQQLKSCNET